MHDCLHLSFGPKDRQNIFEVDDLPELIWSESLPILKPKPLFFIAATAKIASIRSSNTNILLQAHSKKNSAAWRLFICR